MKHLHLPVYLYGAQISQAVNSLVFSFIHLSVINRLTDELMNCRFLSAVFGGLLTVWNTSGSGWVWTCMSAARRGKLDDATVFRSMVQDGQTHGDDLARPVPASLLAWMNGEKEKLLSSNRYWSVCMPKHDHS